MWNNISVLGLKSYPRNNLHRSGNQLNIYSCLHYLAIGIRIIFFICIIASKPGLEVVHTSCLTGRYLAARVELSYSASSLLKTLGCEETCIYVYVIELIYYMYVCT
jgi:hypothetical protein